MDCAARYVDNKCNLEACHAGWHSNNTTVMWTDAAPGALPHHHLGFSTDVYSEIQRRVAILEKNTDKAEGWLDQFLPFIIDAVTTKDS